MIEGSFQGSPELFSFSTAQQERVYRMLKEIGSGPASFFYDACYLMSADITSLRTTTHLVAHLLREVNGALIDLIAPLGDSEHDINKDTKELKKFPPALKFLNISETDELAKRWKKLVKGSNPFYRFAHRSDLTGPRIKTKEFENLFCEIVNVLEIVLDKYKTRFLRITDYIDEIVKREHPPKDIRRRVPATRLAYGYLFRKLENTKWLPDLRKKGFFTLSLPNEDIAFVENSQIYPQGEYLKKMAGTKIQEIQKQVLEIILEIDCSANNEMHIAFCETALLLPADLAAIWANNEAKRLETNNEINVYLATLLGKLISKLAKEGYSKAAIRLASELLTILPVTGTAKKLDTEDEAERFLPALLKLKLRIDEFVYEKVLRDNIPVLAANAPHETLALLAFILEKAVLYKQKEGERFKPYDGSVAWRHAIEGNEERHFDSTRCLLVTAVRDTAEKICISHPEKTGEVVLKVEGYGWDIFRRIGLHLLRVTPNAPRELVRERLLDETLFDGSGVHHEYFHLLKERFGELSPEEQNRILNWIDTADLEKKLLAEREPELTEKQKATRIRNWQYRKLAAIQGYLTGEWKQRFEVMKQQIPGNGMPPDFLIYSSGVTWGGPESPKKPEELAAMSGDEVIDFLKKWKPSGGWDAPTPDSLGGAVGDLAAKDPDRYAEIAQQFMDPDLDPTYIRHLLSGFCRALEKKKGVPFSPVLNLCKWVVCLPTDAPDRGYPTQLRDGFDADRTWRNARSEVLRFVEKALDEEIGLPFEHRALVWSIVKPLTDDPEPDIEYEKKYGDGNMEDPLTLSLNTIRGKALHAAMHYAMWVCRNIKDDVQSRENRRPSFMDIPEVRTVLERHLDTAVDATTTSRAIYGHWLPQLVNIDSGWVRDNLDLIFPNASELRSLREAAWETYLIYGQQLFKSVTRLLMNVYREEVTRLGGLEEEEEKRDKHSEHLAKHVLILYLWGEYGLDEGGLIDQFFKTASPKLTAYALDFIGKDTRASKTVKPEILDRMKALWEWRIQQVGGFDKMPKGELAAFAWWFSGGHFETAWSLAQLEQALKRTEIASYPMIGVLERLNVLFDTFPHEALRCVRLLIDAVVDPWAFYKVSRKDDLWPLLERAMQSEQAEIRETAEAILHRLGSKGYLEYRELLKKRMP